MTTIDHPDMLLSDKRDNIMQAVHEVITADAERERRNREAAANAAIAACLPHVSTLLESYGADPGSGMVSGPCTDPAHALAWISTAAGFAFELVTTVRFADERVDCWLLHPLTGERVYRVDAYATWEDAARAIHAADTERPALFDEDHAAHPAEVLVDALRAFVESLPARHDGDGF